MKVIIDTPEGIAKQAAAIYKEILDAKPNAVLGFATGSTPLDTYAELINVRVSDKQAVFGNDAVQAAVKAAEEAMGSTGRVLLRPSGTEPVIRVMVEAADDADAKNHSRAIADVVIAELGA